MLGATWYYGIYFAGYKIISVAPKRLLKTQISEKEGTLFPPKKIFRPIFSRIVEYEKAWGTIYRSPQVSMTDIAQVLRSFLQNLRGR